MATTHAKKTVSKATKQSARTNKARARALEAVTPAVEVTADARYNWADVTRRIGAPTTEDVSLFGVRESTADLLGRGRQIKSEKILTDLLRWIGQIADDLARIGPSIRVPGFSIGLLRVTAADGLRLKGMLEQAGSSGGAQSALDASRASDASRQFDLGLARRDALRAALKVAAEDAAGRRQVTVAAGTTKDARALRAALDALVGLGRAWMKAGGAAAKRLSAGNVSASLLDETEQLGVEVLDAGEKSTGAKTTAAVTQRDLDLQDGVCLTQMEHLLEMFTAAYAADPRLPHLVPIATRSYFSHQGAKAPAEPPPPEVTTPAPTDGDGAASASAE